MNDVLFHKLRLEVKLSYGVLNVLYCLDVQTSNALCEFANLPRLTVHRKIHSHELQRWGKIGGSGGRGEGVGRRRWWRDKRSFYI
jgi:hypothetical protein